MSELLRALVIEARRLVGAADADLPLSHVDDVKKEDEDEHEYVNCRSCPVL